MLENLQLCRNAPEHRQLAMYNRAFVPGDFLSGVSEINNYWQAAAAIPNPIENDTTAHVALDMLTIANASMESYYHGHGDGTVFERRTARDGRNFFVYYGMSLFLRRMIESDVRIIETGGHDPRGVVSVVEYDSFGLAREPHLYLTPKNSERVIPNRETRLAWYLDKNSGLLIRRQADAEVSESVRICLAIIGKELPSTVDSISAFIGKP